jgi:nucleoside-diphosphate-sugar epimerase
MAPDGNIMITGASGFIGGHVTRYFAGMGHKVQCLVRKDSDISFINGLPVKIIHGDVLDKQSLETSFRGMDAIIHTAGKVGDWGRWDDFYRSNVEGTINVLNAAVANGIRKLVITGSVSSYGEEDHKGLKDENSPFNPHYAYAFNKLFPSAMNYYRDSKALMTREAIRFAEAGNLDIIIIEPVWVYGENEFNTGFYEYLKTVKSGMRFMPGSRGNLFHVIYAGDLAEAYYKAWCSSVRGVVKIIAGNDKPASMNEIYAQFCVAAGLKKPRNLPRLLVYPTAFIMELVYTLFRMRHAPLLTRARVNMFYDSIGYRSINAMPVIGFEAATSLEEGIGKTVKWYQQNKYL